MPTSGKAKATDKGGSGNGQDMKKKCNAISNAQYKAHAEDKRLRGIRNAAANHEESMRMTEHEMAMQEVKRKREAKAAKAAAFLASVEAGYDGSDPLVEDSARPSGSADDDGNASAGVSPRLPDAGLTQVARKMAVLKAVPVQSEAERKAQVAAMVEARRQGFQRAQLERWTPQEEAVGEPAVVKPQGGKALGDPRVRGALEEATTEEAEEAEAEEARLDALIEALSGVVSEAKLDALTDSLATGEISAQQVLKEYSQAAWMIQGPS